MKNLILFDDDSWESLWPLTLTRPVANLLVGALKIEDKWKIWLNRNVSYQTKDYLSKKYKKDPERSDLYVNGSCLPNEAIVKAINSLRAEQYLCQGNCVIAAKTEKLTFSPTRLDGLARIEFDGSVDRLKHPEDVFTLNASQIWLDYELLSQTWERNGYHFTCQHAGRKIYISPGCSINNCVLDSSDGPILIGQNTTILDNSVLRGPVFIGENAVVKAATVIYGGTSIGPDCKVGGEIKNSVFLANSNKGHYGYIGDSVVGEWCNLGAGTTTSNMKNTLGNINLYDIKLGQKRNTHLQFCGAIIGDHTKSSINAMINSGSVIGVNSIVSSGITENYIPSFTWDPNDTYDVDKAIEVARRMYERKDQAFSAVDADILRHIASDFLI